MEKVRVSPEPVATAGRLTFPAPVPTAPRRLHLAIAIAVVPAPLGSVRRQHRWPELGFRWEHERRDSGIGQHIVTTSTSSDPEEADDAGAKQGEQSGGQKHCAPFDATAA